MRKPGDQWDGGSGTSSHPATVRLERSAAGERAVSMAPIWCYRCATLRTRMQPCQRGLGVRKNHIRGQRSDTWALAAARRDGCRRTAVMGRLDSVSARPFCPIRMHAPPAHPPARAGFRSGRRRR